MATKYGGYVGKILLIDLANETFEEYPFTDRQRKETLGGKALAYHILTRMLTGEELPFSEENPVILSTGPLTGTGAPGSVRFDITTLSPKTGLPMSSNCGSSFGLYLKKAGYDALILSGRCKTQRWLEIRENQIRFHDANPLWGTGTGECREILSDRLDYDAYSCLCIGPVGEELLPAATVISDGRAAGRAGFGAVLGWKNLKAITVTGNKAIPLSDPGKTAEEIRNWNRMILQNPLTSDPSKVSSCPGCPIRCKKPGKDPDSMLNDLGIDSIDVQNHLPWLLEKYGVTLENTSASKSGQRRNKFYHSILQSMGMVDCEAVFSTYQRVTEAVSNCGLCIFAVLPCLRLEAENSASFSLSERLPLLLQSSTGIPFSTEGLLEIGKQNLELQNALYHRFSGSTWVNKKG